jgi:hypothetical protein
MNMYALTIMMNKAVNQVFLDGHYSFLILSLCVFFFLCLFFLYFSLFFF